MERRDQLRQDGALAREGGAFVARHRIDTGLREPEWIDAKRANDARIQAPKVEGEDIPVETRRGVEDVTAWARHHVGTTDTADVVRDDAPPMDAREVEVVERSDRAALSVHRQARETCTLHREAEEIGLREDVEHEPAVLEVVLRERRRIFRVHAPDLGHRIRGGGDLLAAPEELACDVSEREALEGEGRRLERRDPVEHDAPRHARDGDAGHRRAGEERARSPARPMANATPSSRARVSRTARSNSVTFHPQSTSGSMAAISAKRRARSARSSRTNTTIALASSAPAPCSHEAGASPRTKTRARSAVASAAESSGPLKPSVSMSSVAEALSLLDQAALRAKVDGVDRMALERGERPRYATPPTRERVARDEHDRLLSRDANANGRVLRASPQHDLDAVIRVAPLA